ncbi:MAG: 30S ribosomal protein S20 [Candidatus Margulisbacteria bacterium]|nr:30S ribosomal protein S20 [Candidatus Margulisiibacteriota bacterium]
MAKRIKSAIKQARKAKKNKARNLEAMKGLKKIVKQAERAIKSKSQDVIDLIRKAISVIDKTAQRKIIHKNKAARAKSKLMAKLNKSKS